MGQGNAVTVSGGPRSSLKLGAAKVRSVSSFVLLSITQLYSASWGYLWGGLCHGLSFARKIRMKEEVCKGEILMVDSRI